MSDHFELQTQYPKPLEHGRGRLWITKEGLATFKLLTSSMVMSRVRIEEAAGHGIALSGVEHTRGGKYILQQWWLRYISPRADGGGA